MEDLKDYEIEPGIVLRLDPIKLAQDSRTETNAKLLSDGHDLSLLGLHFFLVLKRFDEQRYLIQPLFSYPGNSDRDRLVPSLKTGLAHLWTESDSYVFRWHHWLAPVSAILDALTGEETDKNNRRRYASDDPARLAELARPIVRNLTHFHKPNPKPRKKPADPLLTTDAPQ